MATVMTRIEDLMAETDKEAAIRIGVAAGVADEAEAITTIEVGEEAGLLEAEEVIIEVGEAGREGTISRLTTWAPAVVATMHRGGSQITMIMFRTGTITMLRFLPWAAEACLMASKRCVIFSLKWEP